MPFLAIFVINIGSGMSLTMLVLITCFGFISVLIVPEGKQVSKLLTEQNQPHQINRSSCMDFLVIK